MSKSKSPPPAPPPVPVAVVSTRPSEPITRGAITAEQRDNADNTAATSLLATGQQDEADVARRASLVS
jgi:hypothetical protein